MFLTAHDHEDHPVFRRQPAPPHPEAATLAESDADTVEIDPVIQSGNTSVMPPVPADSDPATEVINSVTTGPSHVVHSALDVTMETPEPEPSAQSSPDETAVDPVTRHRREVQARREHRPVKWRPEGVPAMSMQSISENRHLPPPRRPRNQPRTLDSWKATLASIRHDPQTPFYATLIVLAAVVVCWGTMVIFKPTWVPQVINPVPQHPTPSPASYHPQHEPLVPGGGLRTPQTRSERPAGTEGPSSPRKRSETPHKSVPGTPGPTTPTQPGPSQPGEPTHSGGPTPSGPGTSAPPSESTPPSHEPTQEPTHEPTHSQEPTKSSEPSSEPTHSASASPTVTESQSRSAEPSESPVTSPSATSS